MTDEDMIGYVLDLLEPAERRAVEHHISGNATAAARVEQLRATIAPLAVDRDPPLPPVGLATRTLARTAAYIVEHEPDWKEKDAARTSEKAALAALTPVEPSTMVLEQEPKAAIIRGWFRADLFVAAGIGLLIAGLVMSGIVRTREEFYTTACKQNLSTLHKSLVGYSELHDGRFPQIGENSHHTAGTFSAALAQDSGDYQPTKLGFTWHDPANPKPDTILEDANKKGWHDDLPSKVQYAYSLGYRGPDGKLLGLRRHDGEGVEQDLLPIAGDLPMEGASPTRGPYSPHKKGHNVLYVGGNVRFTSSANAGIDGDDIFRNQQGRVAAGLHRNDSVLGRPDDRP